MLNGHIPEAILASLRSARNIFLIEVLCNYHNKKTILLLKEEEAINHNCTTSQDH